MRRIGFRWTLAVLQTVLFVFCFHQGGREYGREWKEVAEHGMPISVYSPPYPPTLALALGMNLPAVGGGSAILVLVHSLGIRGTSTHTDTVSIFVLSVCVALFWFYCGRWIDRQLGWVVSARRLRSSLYWTGLTICILGLALALAPKVRTPAFRDWAIGGWSIVVAICASISYLRVRKPYGASFAKPHNSLAQK
jgi:hypothetical protein